VEAFRQTRAAHASELAEDYVEAIAAMVARSGEARLVDLAREMGVTHVTVHRAIERLAKAGLVTSEPYRAIFLTDKGKALAESCRARHEIVYAFLCQLGVPEAVARRDAEGIEHHVSPETLKAFAGKLRRANS
jgi:DtxR family manganese transport transcriptional regulator